MWRRQQESITKKQTDQLAALDPADDVKDDWNAFVSKVKEINDLLKKTKDAAASKDPKGLTDFQKQAPVLVKDIGAAAAAGVTACG